MKTHVLSIGNPGKQTFDKLTGLPVWVLVAALVVIAGVAFVLLSGRDPASEEPRAAAPETPDEAE